MRKCFNLNNKRERKEKKGKEEWTSTKDDKKQIRNALLLYLTILEKMVLTICLCFCKLQCLYSLEYS